MAFKNKEDQKAYHKKWYGKNREKRIKQIYDFQKKKVKIYHDRIIDYLKKHPCIDCGQSNILTLDFDHRGNKIKEVMRLVNALVSWELIEKEIAKCDVRCANCHRIKTLKGSYRDLPT